MPRPITTFEIEIDSADFALGVDGILALGSQRERNLSIDHRGMNIAADTGDIHTSAIVIDDQCRAVRRLDAIRECHSAG